MTGNRCSTIAHRVRTYVEETMRDEGDTPFVSPGMLLLLLSKAYGVAVRVRLSGYARHWFNVRQLPCKVISIGNITVGGTGKTPMTRYMARQVQALGLKPAIVSRGYKGTAEIAGGIVSDGKRILMDSSSAGDEPYMLATGLKDIPVAVGRDRYATAMALLEICRPEVIILDDAFQHLPLARDLNVVLLDRNRPFGNAYLLPRGPLREPLSALERGDVFILTRSGMRAESAGNQFVKHLPARPVLKARATPVVNQLVRAQQKDGDRQEISTPTDAINSLKAKRVFLFSGLADNQGFCNTVKEAGATVVDALNYTDHYAYTDSDLDRIKSAAVRLNADLIVTTAKDFVRIDQQTTWPRDLMVLDLKIDLGQDQAVLKKILIRHLAVNPPGAGTAP